MMSNTAFRVLAWMALLAVAVVTDGPIGFRPVTHLVSPNVERLLALLVLGTLFALAYPKRIIPIGLFLVIAIGTIEIAQMASFGRHARVRDAAVKIVGVLSGLSVGYLVRFILERRHTWSPPVALTPRRD
jgi:VanZ family protein